MDKWRRNLSVSIFALILSLTACTPSSDLETPKHLEIVITEPDLDTDLSSYVINWKEEGALYVPGSTLQVWRAGNGKDQSVLLFSATVPPSWGASALTAKGAFLDHCRQSLSSPKTLTPQSAWPSLPSGITIIESPHMTLKKPSQSSPLHTVVLLDLSGNADRQTAHTFLLRSYQNWMIRSGLHAASTFHVLITGHSRDSTQVAFRLTVPPETSLGHRLAYVLGGREELRSLPLESDRDSSAVIEAIHLANTLLSEQQGSREHDLFILSDLRQITKQRYAFEKSVPSSDDFQHWLESEALWMDLSATRVLITGVRHQNQNNQHFTAKQDQALKDLWSTTLTAMGSPTVQIVSDSDLFFLHAEGGTDE